MTSSGTSSGESELTTKFDEMSFEEALENIAVVKKWVQEQKKTLSSIFNLEDDGADNSETEVGVDKAFSAFKIEPTKMKMAHDEDSLLEVYKSIYSNPEKLNATSLPPAALPGRVQKLENLLKKHANTLVDAEAMAGQVPAWVIETEDLPNWEKSLKTPTVLEIRRRLEDGHDQLVSVLDPVSYSLSGFFSVFSALVQVDGPVLLIISPRVASSIQMLFPVVILADLINEAKIRDEPISIIVTEPEVLNLDALDKLSAFDKTIDRKSKGMIEIGDGVISNPLSAALTVDTASLWLDISKGRAIHYVIDNSGDIASAVESVSRNAWQCGMSMNHRTRSLVFVHETALTQTILEFKKTIIAQNVNDWEVEYMSPCDFVARHLESSNLLAGLKKLGAKLISSTTDFSSPTLVYDLGLCTELISLKEPNLGHVLLLVPYRSVNELCNLGNNFGNPHRVFIYSNCINTTTSLMKKLNASKVVVNSTVPHLHTELDFPWQIRCKNAAEIQKANKSASYTNLKSLSRCNQWSLLSSSVKIEKLNQLYNLSKVPSSILASLLSYQVDAMRGSSMSLPITRSGVAGIVIGDPQHTSVSLLIAAVSTCLLRDSATVIVSVGSDIQADLKKSVSECGFPDGLVGFTTVGNYSDVKKIASNWELAWAIQGDKEKIAMDFLPTNSEVGLLLVNNNSEHFPDYNCMLAIKNAYKSCLF